MIAHKQNDILRVLTIFSVVLLPLTLLAGIYGMNVGHIPFSDDVHGFWTIVGVMLMLSSRHARPTSATRVAVTERLWAPWRLEYVQGGADAAGCIFCDRRPATTTA